MPTAPANPGNADTGETDPGESWRRGIPTDPSNPKNAAWNLYDATIQNTVLTYGRFLQGKGGYTIGLTLNWLLIKAMCWAEAAPARPRGIHALRRLV